MWLVIPKSRFYICLYEYQMVIYEKFRRSAAKSLCDLEIIRLYFPGGQILYRVDLINGFSIKWVEAVITLSVARVRERDMKFELYNLVSLLGIVVFCAIAWMFSSNRKKVKWRIVGIGLGLQFLFAALVFLVPGSKSVFWWLSKLVNVVLDASFEGVVFVFGNLTNAKSYGVILATQILPLIIVFSSLMGILYYLKVIPWIIKMLARFIFKFLGTSGAESLCAASNIFVGIEASTTIRPYIRKMTRSELFLILTVGMATVASSVLAVYVSFLRDQFPTIAGHLISASILSVPASIVICKLMEPETGKPKTSKWKKVKLHTDDDPKSLTESAIVGAQNGAKLAVGVGITLIAFVGILGILRMVISQTTDGGVTLELILSYIFYPLTWLMGVSPCDISEVSKLLGIRLILTEIPAYLDLADISATIAPRSLLIASYALCGFAHVASMAIFVGGIGALAPEKMPELSRLGFKALLAATLVTLMTGAVAGLFYCGPGILTGM